MKPRRQAYLLKKFPRLSETFILNELLGQEALGADIHVFSRRTPDDEPRHPQLGRLRATVEQLPSSREVDPWSELFLHDDGDLLRRVETVTRGGLLAAHPRFPMLLSEAVLLRRRCRELSIGHVHAHFATEGAFVAHLLHALGGPSYSLTMHAKDIYRSTVDGTVLGRVLRDAAFAITVCDANVRWLEGLLGPETCTGVRRLYNGVDLSVFAAEVPRRDTRHILSVGRLVEKKGFDVLIDALALLASRGDAFTATIVGQGEDGELLRARAADRGLDGRVHFAGALDQEAVRALLCRASVFALPCVVGEDGNRDALPTVLLEALACGLPCVSTPVTGIPEILDHGRAGLLVQEHDVPGTADAIARLLDDPMLCRRFADEGRRRAERLFDLRGNARVLRGWFRNALSLDEAACSSPT